MNELAASRGDIRWNLFFTPECVEFDTRPPSGGLTNQLVSFPVDIDNLDGRIILQVFA